MHPEAVDAFRVIREWRGTVARSLRSLVLLIQHTGSPQHLLDHVRRLSRWFLRAAQPSREDAVGVGLPRIEVPAWWRLAGESEGAYEQWAASLPDNWRGLSMPELQAVADTMERTGWVLAWVPREEIVRDLIAARDREQAQSRLLSRQGDVLDDLKRCLGDVRDPSLTQVALALHQGVWVYEDGYSFPAQAIAAVVLTSLISQQLDTMDGDGSPLLTFRRNALLRAGGTALNSYWPSPNDPVPSLFNPYATAHRFDLTHFHEANSLAGLTLGVSFLRDLQAVAGT